MYLHPAIEELLGQASSRRRWLLFLQRSAKLATLSTALVLLLGLGMVAGWLTSAALVTVSFLLVIMTTMFAWMVITLVTVCAMDSHHRPWLAAAVERCHKPLMDRLNTLVFLEQARDKQSLLYVKEIEKQTQEELMRQSPALPFSPREARRHAGIFGVTLAATILFYGGFRPWQYVAVAENNIDAKAVNDTLLEIPPPAKNPQETLQEAPWGDVRISEPGKDLLVTSLDVIPLRIEAAANRPLKSVEWFTAVNGADDVQHPLATPDDPQYAVYQPELSLQAFATEPWDVVRYFARATTHDGATYDSELYFIEVVPFRAELEELPGGQQSEGFAHLEQLTSMIERQNEVIRQTHRQARISEQSPESLKKRLEQLAHEEARLRQEASHLAADIASRKKPSETDGPEENLQQAASTLENAEDSLLDNELAEAAQNERSALDDLVAARKDLQEFLRQHPDAFEQLKAQNAEQPPAEDAEQLEGQSTEQPQGQNTEQPEGQSAKQPQSQNAEQPPDSSANADTQPLEERLRDMEANQQQLQAAREWVQQTLLAERNLERQANPSQQKNFPKLAQEQQQLNRSLQDFVKKNSPSFCRSQAECNGAQSAMNRTAQSLSAENPNARQEAGKAAEALQKLDDSLEQQQQLSRLADAYRLRKMLEQQISQLARCQQNGLGRGQGERLARQVERTTSQLKQIAESEQTKEYFGEKLREALSEQNMAQARGQCSRLGQSGDPKGQKAAAGELAQNLRKVAKAFDASCPGGTRPGSRGSPGSPGDRLMAEGHDALARGLRQLESAARSQASGRALTSQDRARLARDARSNLGIGISSLYGNNDRSEQVLNQLEEKLEGPEFAVDMQSIRDLLSQIQQLGREGETRDKPEEGRAKTGNVDLSRLPPAYRQSIEKYFEKLSEQ